MYIAMIACFHLGMFCLVLFVQGAALVHIYLDGSVLVSHGGVESGQGLHTKMIQVSCLFPLVTYWLLPLHCSSGQLLLLLA